MSSMIIAATLNDTTNSINKSKQVSVTTTGENVDHRIVPVTTSEYEFTIDAGIGSPGYCFVRNCDSTNFVNLGFATETYSMKLLAGDVAVFPLVATQDVLYLIADTATCNVEIFVHEA